MTVDSLFGCKVIGSTEDFIVVLHRQRRVALVLIKSQPQVEYLDDTFGVDQEVCGFHIAMDQALFVGVLKSMGGLGDVIGDDCIGERSMLFDQDLQIDPFDVLHDDVMGVFFMIDVVGSNDVRMV